MDLWQFFTIEKSKGNSNFGWNEYKDSYGNIKDIMGMRGCASNFNSCQLFKNEISKFFLKLKMKLKFGISIGENFRAC